MWIWQVGTIDKHFSSTFFFAKILVAPFLDDGLDAVVCLLALLEGQRYCFSRYHYWRNEHERKEEREKIEKKLNDPI